MPTLERRRAGVVAAIASRMVPADDGGAGPASEQIAAILFNLLLDGGSDLAAFGALRGLSEVRKEHFALGVSGRHYSRFGVALGPALRNVIGPSISSEAVSGWCDTFWIVVRAIGSSDQSSFHIIEGSAPDRTGFRLISNSI